MTTTERSAPGPDRREENERHAVNGEATRSFLERTYRNGCNRDNLAGAITDLLHARAITTTALREAVERAEGHYETERDECPDCCDGTVVSDTCDDCGERHCSTCSPCDPDTETKE